MKQLLRILPLLLLTAMLPALLGVELVRHVCSHAWEHEHTHVNTLASLPVGDVCLCSHDHEEAAPDPDANRDCSNCTSTYYLLKELTETLISNLLFEFQTATFVVGIPGLLIEPLPSPCQWVECLFFPPSIQLADWQSFSGTFRC